MKDEMDRECAYRYIGYRRTKLQGADVHTPAPPSASTPPPENCPTSKRTGVGDCGEVFTVHGLRHSCKLSDDHEGSHECNCKQPAAALDAITHGPREWMSCACEVCSTIRSQVQPLLLQALKELQQARRERDEARQWIREHWEFAHDGELPEILKGGE